MNVIGENPYVGAQPLTAKNPLFGRDREVRDLYFLLCKERIVLMYAPSGAGKSSLLEGHGGLLDAMYERFHVWPVTRVNTQPAAPCQNPYVLSALLGFERAAPPEHMRSEAELARLTLREGVMGRWRHPGDPPLILLVFDQFEEIVRLNPADVDRQREFFQQLGDLLAEPSVWALLVMREDYLASIDPYCRQLPTYLRNRFRLDLLGREAAAEAIAYTAKTAGRYWEQEAVKQLVNDLALMKIQPMHGAPYVVPGQYVEPLQLQVVCRDLWDKLAPDDESFGMDDLAKIGNVDNALGAYYRRIVGEISAGSSGAERAMREWIAKKLISPGHVRGQVLRGPNESGGLPNAVIEQLVLKHLVRAEKRAGATWYELAHDRLIAPVETDNGRWFEENLSALERRVALWLEQVRSPDLLATGGLLREFRRWARANPSRIQEHERSYLFLSARENGKVWFQRGLFACAIVAALVAFYQGSEAGIKTDDALYNAAVGYSSRADESLSRGAPEEAWLYTLASLSDDWSSAHSLPESFGRLMRFEIYPWTDWRNQAKRASAPVRRRAEADRILSVSATSDSANHTFAVLQRFTENGFEVYLSAPDERGAGSFTLLSVYNFQIPRPFGPNFSGELLCVTSGDKRYYAGGNQLVEEEGLVRPGEGRKLVAGASPIIALRSTARGIGVLTRDGRLRFANTAKMSWEPGEWNLPAEGLVGFDVADDALVTAHEASAGQNGRVSRWTLDSKNGWELVATVLAEGLRAVSIVETEPLIAAYGTSLGEVGLVNLSPHYDSERLVARTAMHRSAVIHMARGGASEKSGDLISVAEDGEVRRIKMAIKPLNESREYLIWQLAIEPREEETRALFARLREESLKLLPFRWEPPRFVVSDPRKLAEVTSELFGRESPVRLGQFGESTLIRSAAGKWTWSSPSGQTELVEKRRDASTLVLSEGGNEFRVPLRPGAWVVAGAAALTRVSFVLPDRIGLAAGYLFEVNEDVWQIGSGGEMHPQPWKAHDSAQNGELTLTAGDNGASIILPKRSGPLVLRTDPVAQPAAIGKTTVTMVNSLANPWESTGPSHRIQYSQVSVNSEENVTIVSPRQPVSLRFHWEIKAGEDLSKQHNFLLGIAAPESAISRCVASIGGPRPIAQRRSGAAQLDFRAPSKPGLYFVTHAAVEGEKCSGQPGLHANGPENAVAAIRVLKDEEYESPR